MTVNRQFSYPKFSFISNSKSIWRRCICFSKSQFKEQTENHNLGDGADEILRPLKLKCLNRLVIGHLNINSLLNKFDSDKFELLVK